MFFLKYAFPEKRRPVKVGLPGPEEDQEAREVTHEVSDTLMVNMSPRAK